MMNSGKRNLGDSKKYSKRITPCTGKTNFNKNVNEINCSVLIDLTKCFSESVDNSQIINAKDSEDLFSETDDLFAQNLGGLSQSTPLLKSNFEQKDDKLINTAKQIFCDNDTFLKPNQTHNPNDTLKREDPFGESLNISCIDLNKMHTKNLEMNVINESSKLKDLSQIDKSSQYKHEVIDTFNAFESTINNLNQDLFKENASCGNNSIWERTMNEKADINDSFEPNIPNNLSQLFTGLIEAKNNTTSTTDASNNKNGTNSSILNNSSQILVKKSKTPLSDHHFNSNFYGLPQTAQNLIKQYKSIDKLYDWQNECLTLPAIKNRDNLIYALPTSGGKTLVAEILMLREVVCRKKNVLFILPFVSIVQEKVWGLSPFAVGLDFLVEEYAGGKGIFPPKKRKSRNSIYIATIEKGLSVVRSLLENNRLQELGLIVVDELHLVGEPTRGCTLEILLTNVMYSREDIQIVGMSATIGNIDEIAKFLSAEVYMKDFRPVELKEYIKFDTDIMQINWNAKNQEEKVVFNRKIDFGYSAQIEKLDPDHLGGLVMEVIPNGSCLIFCPTKKNCENVAVLLCKVIFKKLLEYRTKEKIDLEKALKSESGTDESLTSLLKWGIAYHHSGLTTEERRLIEEAFRAGVLSVLCCTSTLAAGVNLPAQRVILRSPTVGRDFITLSMYKQMVGRAGRAGYGGFGDSILICHSYQITKVQELFNSPMDKAMSNLHGNEGANMRSLILGAIALKVANSRKMLRMLTNSSLLAIQIEALGVDLKKLLDKNIESLLKMRAITIKEKISVQEDIDNICESLSTTQHTRRSLNRLDSRTIKNQPDKRIVVSNDTELIVSRLGKAAVKGSIELQRAHMLYGDLMIAQNNLVVIGVLHMLYLVTPYDLSETIKPNLSNYYTIYSKMDNEGFQTAKVIGLTESVAIQMAQGKTPKSISERVMNRFYVTLMLLDLWNQSTLKDVSEKFQVNKGLIQNLMVSTATFASSVLRFCEELQEFWAFKDLLVNFNQRLSHFCTLELLPLMELPNVRKGRAMQLYKAGYRTLQSIAQARPIDLIESIEHMNRNVANKMIASAKLQLLEKVENLREEAEEVMNGLDVKIQ